MGVQYTNREPRVTTAVRLPESLRDELRNVARRRDVSVNYLVNRAVVDFLGRLDPAPFSDPAPFADTSPPTDTVASDRSAGPV